MSREFWEIESVRFEGNVLRVAMVELTWHSDDVAPNALIGGVEIAGPPLKVPDHARQIKINFSKVIEFRVTPEICSWPGYENGEEICSALLYRKPGLFFYGDNRPEDFESFDLELGWVKVQDLHCYIVHSESFDIYVLSKHPPTVEVNGPLV